MKKKYEDCKELMYQATLINMYKTQSVTKYFNKKKKEDS